MQKSGYYEIMNRTGDWDVLKMRALAGNVQFNRLHWHDSLEIMCCLHGSFRMTIQGCPYILQKGDLITVNPGLNHEISDGTADGLQLIFSVDASLLRTSENEEYTFSTVGNNPLPHTHEDIRTVRLSIASLVDMLTPENEEMDKIFLTPNPLADIKLFEHCLDSDEKWYCVHMELYRILMCLSRHKQISQQHLQASKPFQHLTRCVEIIHKDYDKPLSAKVLADRVGFSEPTIYRLFQNHMGISFTNYLNLIRISAACGLLENSELNVTEISGQCGFSSLSNFYRAFHQFAGYSPREYRNHCKGQGVIQKGVQKDLMMLNRFQPIWELPYAKDDLKKLAMAADAP